MDTVSVENQYQDVILHIDLPRKFTTKLQTADETRINDIMVLVLEAGEFQYMVSGISIANNSANATATFKARLLSTDATLQLFLVANSTNEIINSGVSQGDTETEVKEKIARAFTSVGFPYGFPMFGQYELAGVPSTGAVISGIRLVRSIARADVDASLVNDVFSLATIQSFRATNYVQVIPDVLPSTNVVTAPSVQTGWTTSVQTAVQNTTSVVQSMEQVYLPEAVSVGDLSNFTQATCVVIGGYYADSDVVTYYRLDFKKSDGSYPFGQILRNHRYLFTILSVEGPGWETPEEAANNMDTEIEVIVQEWNEEDLEAYFDGTNHFILSPRKLQLEYRADASGVFHVDTNVDTYTIEWTEGANAGVASATSISNEYFELTISNDKTEIRARTLQQNTTNDEITSSFLIRAKRLVIPATVVQLPQAKFNNEIIRVLSLEEAGGFGSGTLTTITNSRTTGMRRILENHFGTDKTVSIGNIYFTYLGSGTSINSQLTDDILSQQDIIYLNNNIRPNASTAQRIMNWLDAKSSRVLMVGYDWKDPGTGDTRTNWEVLKILRAQNEIIPYWYNNGSVNPVEEGDTPGIRYPFRVPFVINEKSRYFFEDGPFTSSPYTPVTSCYSWCQDQYWGRIEPLSSSIIPLINYSNPLQETTDNPWATDPTGDGKMMFGVDPVRRIVYVGDAQMFENYTGSIPALQNARINNTTGELSNDYSRIIANMWAWMIEKVVLGQ